MNRRGFLRGAGQAIVGILVAVIGLKKAIGKRKVADEDVIHQTCGTSSNTICEIWDKELLDPTPIWARATAKEWQKYVDDMFLNLC